MTLTCPAGRTILSIAFASYGTPTGMCGSYVTSSCHSTTSVSVVNTACVGQNSCTVPATNANFGDPCVGTVKSSGSRRAARNFASREDELASSERIAGGSEPS